LEILSLYPILPFVLRLNLRNQSVKRKAAAFHSSAILTGLSEPKESHANVAKFSQIKRLLAEYIFNLLKMALKIVRSGRHLLAKLKTNTMTQKKFKI
jgi:hypothetical protein